MKLDRPDHRYACAAVPIWLLLCIFTIPMLAFHLDDDHGMENEIAADLVAAQNEANRVARMNQALTNQCLESHGYGAAVIYDEDGNFKRCQQRRKK